MEKFQEILDLDLISNQWAELNQYSLSKENEFIQKETPNPDFKEISPVKREESNYIKESKYEELVKATEMFSKDSQSQKMTNNTNANNSKTRNHFPQIIDEDTESFRIKLDHLINIFKSDAIKEFMMMKKLLLESQVRTIKNETERYLNMYEEKHIQLEKTNEKLAEKIHENDVLNQRLAGMAILCGKYKTKKVNHKILRNYFTKLLAYKQKQMIKKKVHL